MPNPCICHMPCAILSAPAYAPSKSGPHYVAEYFSGALCSPPYPICYMPCAICYLDRLRHVPLRKLSSLRCEGFLTGNMSSASPCLFCRSLVTRYASLFSCSGRHPLDVWSSLCCGGHLEGILPSVNLPLTNP